MSWTMKEIRWSAFLVLLAFLLLFAAVLRLSLDSKEKKEKDSQVNTAPVSRFFKMVCTAVIHSRD